MGIFTFIICFLILLLIIIIIGSIEQFTLWLVTKRSNEFVIMIIPALLSLTVFLLIIYLTYFILDLFNINTINILFSMFMNFEYNFHSFIYMIMGYSACSIIFILLQAFCLKLINIDYKKIFNFIKYKILRKKEIKSLGVSENDKASVDLTHNSLPAIRVKTSFFHYISASLFSFALSLFSISLLIYIGIMIGEKYII